MTQPPLSEALQILITAEASICELIQDATEARDYASVSELSALAQRIGHLRGELDRQQEGEDRPTPEAAPTARSDVSHGPTIDLTAPWTPSGRLAAVRRKVSQGEGERPPSWPRFSRDGSDLVMTESDPDGSSRRSIAGQNVVDEVTSCLENLHGDTAVEDLRSGVRLMVQDGIGNKKIDVVVAWLREERILLESRRGAGFVEKSGADIRAVVARRWAALRVE